MQVAGMFPACQHPGKGLVLSLWAVGGLHQKQGRAPLPKEDAQEKEPTSRQQLDQWNLQKGSSAGMIPYQ